MTATQFLTIGSPLLIGMISFLRCKQRVCGKHCYVIKTFLHIFMMWF